MKSLCRKELDACPKGSTRPSIGTACWRTSKGFPRGWVRYQAGKISELGDNSRQRGIQLGLREPIFNFRKSTFPIVEGLEVLYYPDLSGGGRDSIQITERNKPGYNNLLYIRLDPGRAYLDAEEDRGEETYLRL